jgi:hypothetical protein
MDSVSKPVPGPVIVTITGDAGRGKTNLAATFPKPIFSRFEDGMQSISEATRPDAFPVIAEIDDVFEQARALLTEDHDYKTWVVDSVSAADRFFGDKILANDGKARNLQQACGGYGAGFDVLAGYHSRMRKAAGVLAARKGMNTVFIAHADTIRIEPPNEDAYSSYTLRLNKKSIPYYLDDVDLVGFIKLETVVIGDEGERKKAISDGTRILIAYVTAENVSKNRYGITEPLYVKLGENPLIPFIPHLAPPVVKQQRKKEAAQ